MSLLSARSIILCLLTCAALSSNIEFDVSYTHPTLILYMKNIDVSCGGSVTQIAIEINHNEPWILPSNSPNPIDNSYHFDIEETIDFPFNLSVTITRTFNHITDTINCTHTIISNSDTIDFGTNFCIEMNPYIWYLDPALNIAYLYHQECVKIPSDQDMQPYIESLCMDDYAADGVASIPTSKHYLFAESVVANRKPSGSCNWQHISIGASLRDDFVNTSCTQEQKKRNYVFWNGDVFNESVFIWTTLDRIVGCGTDDERYLHLKYSNFEADDARGNGRYAVLCYKNMISYATTNDLFTSSTLMVIATLDTLDTEYIEYKDNDDMFGSMEVIFIVSGCVLCLLLGCIVILKTHISSIQLHKQNTVQMEPDNHLDKEMDILSVQSEEVIYNDVRRWLMEEVQLLMYYDIFISNGYTRLDIIKDINNDEEILETIGICFKEHRLHILEMIGKLEIEGIENMKQCEENRKRDGSSENDNNDGTAGKMTATGDGTDMNHDIADDEFIVSGEDEITKW